MTQQTPWSLLGCGIGLRPAHYGDILERWPQVDWFEATTENYMDSGGKPLKVLEKVRAHYPVALHGVALSIGSVDPLNQKYLERWKTLIERIDPVFVSDHICWSGVNHEQLHDLLPLPFTEESLKLLTERIDAVQNFLGRQILLENVSTYITYKHSTMSEWEFVRAVAERSGCGLLLDINNIYVNAFNHKIDAREYIRQIPARFVGYIHMAGHTDKGNYLFDTHSKPVIEPVWDLYREALQIWGKKSTLIEWDEDIPAFPELVKEAEKAKSIYLTSPEEPQMQAMEDGAVQKTPQLEKAPTLVEVESWLKAHIHYEPGAPGNVQNNSGLFRNIPEERLEVYRGGYLARTEEALKEVYEAVRHVMGEKAFHQLAERYARFHASRDYNLSHKGEKLPEFLKTTSWIKNLPFLSDLARLEWFVAAAFHAAERPPLDQRTLSAMAPQEWEQMRFAFQPSVQFVESAWPILDIWQARDTPVREIKINVVNRPQSVLIARRRGEEVFVELLTAPQMKLMRALADGRPLAEAVAEIASDDQEDLRLDQWFAHWMQNGLITDCEAAHNTGCR